ncbi:hypothetical protein [Neptuniibacter sp. QD37_11]|uniref:hypothetical protein n=1 Tax=Neptuniibacter sp. QD37_11 TaxID=3398209 RepID=UPI0039F44D00
MTLIFAVIVALIVFGVAVYLKSESEGKDDFKEELKKSRDDALGEPDLTLDHNIALYKDAGVLIYREDGSVDAKRCSVDAIEDITVKTLGSSNSSSVSHYVELKLKTGESISHKVKDENEMACLWMTLCYHTGFRPELVTM